MPLNALDAPWWFPALQVYAGVLILGFAFWPLWTRVWCGRGDRGAGLWPAGGVFVYVLAMQLCWRTGFLRLHMVWAMLLILIIAFVGWFLLPSEHRSGVESTQVQAACLRAFSVFSILFWFWVVIRSADPGVHHTEQPMDMMWMRSAMSSDAPPIRDSWFAGEPATYYAEGHQALGFLGLLFGLHPAVAVHTGQIIWFALMGLLAFDAGGRLGGKRTSERFYVPAGILAGIGVCFVSTLPGFTDAFTRDGFWWWWDASRVLQDGQTQLITEFPFFSFYLGDNHAHLLGVPVLFMSLLSADQLARTKTISFAVVLPAALSIAWSWRINPWQLPTCAALAGAGFLLRGRILSRKEWSACAWALIPAALLLFPPLAPGPRFALQLTSGVSTTAMDVVLVFGFFLPGCVWALVRAENRLPKLLLVLCLGMWTTCEVVYFQDSFHHRMNTVFKVYYQIWILLAVVAAAGWAGAVQKGKRLRGLAAASLTACLLPGLVYAVRLSSEAFTAESRSLHAWSVEDREDQIFLEIADSLIQAGELILEAPGISYQPNTSRLGTWTAGDTLQGWAGHLHQWRPGQSLQDPLRLYRATSQKEFHQIQNETGADWVLLGPRERATVVLHPDWLDWMDDTADRVMNQPDRILFRIR